MSTPQPEPPSDYLEPKWDVPRPRVHQWTTYISDELREMWPTFTPEQRAAIARNAAAIASDEEWD